MIWLTWRQVRAQTLLVLVAAAAVATVLALTGPALHRSARAQVDVVDVLSRSDRDLFFTGIVVLAVLPALIGAFWGAPLVAREMEAGTLPLAWSQGVTRTRWLTTKLAVGLGATTVAVGLVSWAVTWWSGPLTARPGAGREACRRA